MPYDNSTSKGFGSMENSGKPFAARPQTAIQSSARRANRSVKRLGTKAVVPQTKNVAKTYVPRKPKGPSSFMQNQ